MPGGSKWYPMCGLLPVCPNTPKCTVVVPELALRKEMASHVGEETDTYERVLHGHLSGKTAGTYKDEQDGSSKAQKGAWYSLTNGHLGEKERKGYGEKTMP